jgi:hypothetical protein
MIKQAQRIKAVHINVNDGNNSNSIPLSQKGQPNGVATLDGTGKVPLAQIPTIPVIAAGSNGQLQFNNAGGLGADSTLFWDNTNKSLFIGASSEVSYLNGGTLVNPQLQIIAGNSVGAGGIQPQQGRVSIAFQNNAQQSLMLFNRGTNVNNTVSLILNNHNLDGNAAYTGFEIRNSTFGGVSGFCTDFRTRGTSPVSLMTFGGGSFINILPNIPTAKVGINLLTNTTAPAAKLHVRGEGTTFSTFGLQVHNSTGTNNALVVRDDGNIGIGTNAPQTTLHVRNSGAIPQLRIDNGVNGGNGLSGSIQFTDNNTSFIAMSRTGGTSCIISIPPNNNNQDGSHLHIQYNNTGTGFYIFPRRSHDSLGNRTVLKTDGDANNGNQSRGIDFINGSAGNTFSYTLPAYRFYSAYKTAINSYGLRLQINNVTQERANNNFNLAEIWGVNTLFGLTDNSTVAVDNSAILDLQSTNRGFLPPRMTTSNFNTIANKAAGLLAYSNDDNGLLFWDGTRITGFRYNGTKFQGYDGTSWNDLN